MAGPNTSGQTKPEDYNLGRGVVYVAELDATTKLPDSNGFRDLGNAPEFNITPTEETLQHFSSRGGLKKLDREVTMSQQIGGSFNFDEFNDENLALLFNGTQATFVNPAVAGFTNATLVTAVALGRWYDLQTTAGVRAMDVPTGSAVFSDDPGGTPTVLVEGTDYEYDPVMGRIFFLESAVNTAAGNDVGVVVAAVAAAAGVINEVRAHTSPEKSFALKFIAENPNDNDSQTEYTFHKVQLKSQSDISLIGDDWSQATLTFSAEENKLADANSPTLTIRSHANS